MICIFGNHVFPFAELSEDLKSQLQSQSKELHWHPEAPKAMADGQRSRGGNGREDDHVKMITWRDVRS
jgi:hypothetical protein